MVKRISAVTQERRTGARTLRSLTCYLLSRLLLIAAPGQLWRSAARGAIELGANREEHHLNR
jgi:hypothetical protein